MGLTNWRGENPRKTDTEIAKNYLNEGELLALNNLTEQYLVFAEGQAMRRIRMYMSDWIIKLDAFLNINDREILTNAGRISHELALEHAHKEYGKFHSDRIHELNQMESDFDKSVKTLLENKANKRKK